MRPRPVFSWNEPTARQEPRPIPEPSEEDGLTEDQQIAYGLVAERIAAGERYTKIEGFAGTGKTYLTGKLIDALASTAHIVHVAAPTHKAVEVLSRKIARRDVVVSTIQSFLALKLQRDGEGGYSLRRDYMKDLPERGIVFVDEASMVGADLWQHIETSPPALQWVFIGDPAQLPPVNEDPSPVFTLPGHTLTDVVRQAEGNPIIELATAIRTGKTQTVQTAFAEGIGIGVTKSQEDFVARAVHQFQSPDFEGDSAHARVLCYRNAVVSEYNTEIRRRLFGRGAARFSEGEWLVASETYQQFGKPYLQNSEEVRVAGVDEGTVWVQGEQFRVWMLDVKGGRASFMRTLPVLHESERARYQKAVDHRRASAKRDGWQKFYELREAFAQVEYLYAMTVHKSQGSTFHTAFVDWQDLRLSSSDRIPLMYVAATRPSHRLAVLL